MTPGGKIARSVFNRLSRNAPKWVLGLKLKTPSGDICHPNAVSFATTVGQVSKCRADYGHMVVDLRNFHTGSKSRRWEGGIAMFYSELQAVHTPFNVAVVNEKRMAVVAAIRKVVMPMVGVEIERINHLIGNEDDLAPIDLGVRINRLICQMHLQKLATSRDLIDKIATVMATELKPTVAGAAAHPQAAAAVSKDLTRCAKRSFFQHCYEHMMHCLGAPNVERNKLLERLGIQLGRLDPAVDVEKGCAKGGKQMAGKAFQVKVASLFRDWRNRPNDLKMLIDHGPGRLVECLVSATNGEFELDQSRVEQLLKAAPQKIAKANVSEPAKEKKDTQLPKGFCFVPKMPVVKTVFETKLPIGMFLVSNAVAAEIIVSASRRVVEPANLKSLGLDDKMVASKLPEKILCAALHASFKQQRSYFQPKVKGTEAGFKKGLQRIFQRTKNEYVCQANTACLGEEICVPFALSLFDYRSVLAKTHYGKVLARTDGRSLNLTGLLPESKGQHSKIKQRKVAKEKSGEVLEETRARFQELVKRIRADAKKTVGRLCAAIADTAAKDEELLRKLRDAEKELNEVNVLFVGLDCGKSGFNAVMAPEVIPKAVKFKAQAEGKLTEAKERLVKADEDDDEEASKKVAVAEREEATLSEGDVRKLFEHAQVPSHSSSRSGDDPLRKNQLKRVHIASPRALASQRCWRSRCAKSVRSGSRFLTSALRRNRMDRCSRS